VNRTARILAGAMGMMIAVAALAPVRADQQFTTATPEQLVAAYGSLADTILSAKKTESSLVHAILATTYGHARGAMASALDKMKAGKDARADVEALATLVSQLGNEGDAAVAGVRKRLVEAGHHHHASTEQQGQYDEGFVVVTRAAKKVFMDAAGQIGKMAASPSPAALEAEWQKVQKQYQSLTAPKK